MASETSSHFVHSCHLLYFIDIVPPPVFEQATHPQTEEMNADPQIRGVPASSRFTLKV